MLLERGKRRAHGLWSRILRRAVYQPPLVEAPHPPEASQESADLATGLAVGVATVAS
jgi:hypothetical protein